MTSFREPVDAVGFHAELQKLPSVAACADFFKRVVSLFGIEAFACGEADLADHRRSVIFVAEWPPALVRFYVRSNFSDRDPILLAVQARREPFSFSDMAKHAIFSEAEREAMRFAVEQGWTQGLVVPVDRGGERVGLVTLIGRGKELEPAQRSFLCLASECFLNRVRALAADIVYSSPPAGLSLREIEAIKLVARGMSDSEIAVALRISKSTAHKHVESARRRLGARNRAHMAALAMSLGIANAA